MDELLRFLDLVTAELGGAEAKMEIGGDDPRDPCAIWVHTEGGFRLVLRFETAPADPAGMREKLAAMAHAFADTEHDAAANAPRGAFSPARHDLGELLSAVSELARAERAVVIDETSPVVFGDSHDRVHPIDVFDAMFAARSIVASKLPIEELAVVLDSGQVPESCGLDTPLVAQLEVITRPPPGVTRPGQLRLCAAIAAVREDGDEPRCIRDTESPHLSRPFANVYRAVLVFPESFSEIHADGHLVRALPAIENKTLALPPLEPKGGAKVRRLRPT